MSCLKSYLIKGGVIWPDPGGINIATEKRKKSTPKETKDEKLLKRHKTRSIQNKYSRII